MPDWKLWVIAFVLCASSLAASADDSEAGRLIAECGAKDLPQTSVDSCLERVRVLEEAEPSAQLQSVEATLEKREVGETIGARAEVPSGPPADFSPRARAAAPPSQEGDEYTPENHDRGSSQTLSGSEADDQPPIADPPAGASEDHSDGQQPDDPE